MADFVPQENLYIPNIHPWATNFIASVLVLYVVHQIAIYLEYPILSPQELLWNVLVFATPSRLLLDSAKRQELKGTHMLSQTRAAKSEALRKMLGFGTGALSHKLVGGEGIMRNLSISNTPPTAYTPTTDAPPGLGNWDNSCYQNSVLQGLASLRSIDRYLDSSRTLDTDANSTAWALRETLRKLNDAANNGRQLWTPAKLKSMSSWQQQDAQEYFSKIMDELDKEAAKARSAEIDKPGLETLVDGRQREHETAEDKKTDETAKNPLEGLLAQRVACTSCGHSDGLSMIPFNCLTLPLGSTAMLYDLRQCLDEYTKLEDISDVDCPKCTLLRAQTQLKQMLPPEAEAQSANNGSSTQSTKRVLELPPELRVLAMKRLRAIQQALDEDEFSDKTINDVCQIPKKAHVSSTKTRQAVIGRAPQSLVMHINRSVFDELTGAQRKNYAAVRYPLFLNLDSWVLGEEPPMSAKQSMLQPGQGSIGAYRYKLRAVVTHYGRHENGHYVCYRRHPILPRFRDGEVDEDDMMKPAERWWRLSDESVSAVTEGDVLDQGGVFMLFYEREPPEIVPQAPLKTVTVTVPGDTATNDTDAAMRVEEAAATPLPVDETESQEILEEAVDISIKPPTSVPIFGAEKLHNEVAVAAAPLAVGHAPAHNAKPLLPTENLPTGISTAEHADTGSFEAVVSVPPKPSTPPLMRTARGRQSSSEAGFGSNLRPVAAT